ncbi:MAG: iron-sulfur cluster assembly accessory protein [Rubrivivax sp.]|nr:iron-sulfur cluster assembly accessory protein [Rubrivivax sp.]
MAITMTEAAARRVNRHLAQRGKGVGVRLSIKPTGCSGLSYQFEYADEALPGEIEFETRGVKLLVDPKNLPFVDGAEVDFVREGLNESFKVRNPLEKDRCGCGESFRV